jgi:transcriptional regulator with XRE-family HTH domain
MKTPTQIEATAKAQGMKMSDVLRRANIAHSTWWRWKKGRFSPRFATVEKIEKALKPRKK